MAQEKEEPQKPLTREDVLRLIEENGGTAKGLDLSEKVFEEGVDLHGLNLNGVILKGARFPTHFEGNLLVGAKFDGSSLIGADLRTINFQYAQFKKFNNQPTCLAIADLRGSSLLNANFQGADLTSAKFGDVAEAERYQAAMPDDTDFRGANLFRANFKGCYFYGTKLEGAFIRGADILEAHLEEADWGNYNIGEESKKEELHFAGSIYRRLKMWYKNAGISDIAAKFYYREKEANRKRLKLLSRDWHHRIASELIRAIFGYGERWWNIVFSIEALILLFAFTYLAIAASWEWWRILLLAWIPGLIVWFAYLKFTTGLNWTWWKKAPFWAAGMVFLFCAFYFLSGLVLSRYVFLHHLYFSTVSFTALGYGEWVKLNYSSVDDAIKGIGAFESLVGVSMLALLLVTFFRKWTR